MVSKQLRRLSVLFLITTALYIPNSMAIHLDLLGAVTSPNADGTPKPTGKLGLPGGGLVLNFRLGSRAQLELGWLYLSRTYATTSEYTLRMSEVLAGFKIYLARALFIDFGGYSNTYITKPVTFDGNDLGVFAGLGIKLPLSHTMALQLSGQYHYALNQITYAGGNYKPHEAVLMAGFSFGMR